MPAKSGFSHAMAAFLSIILGAIISNFLSAHTELLTDLSQGMGQTIARMVGASLPEEVAGLLVISSVLAFGWGIAYHYARHRSGDRNPWQKRYGTDTQVSHETRDMPQRDETEAVTSSEQDGERSYRNYEEALRADERLRSTLKRDLEDVKSRLDDAHDSLYDKNEREKAQRITDFLGSITVLERELRRTELSSPTVATGTHEARVQTAIDADAQQTLIETHEELLKTGEHFVDTAEKIQNEPEKIGDGVLSECERLIADLKRKLAERQAINDRTGGSG